MPAEPLQMSSYKHNLHSLILHNPEKAAIFRKILVRKLGRELFKPFKGQLIRITGKTDITDKVVRKNYIAVRFKSHKSDFSGSTPHWPKRSGNARK